MTREMFRKHPRIAAVVITLAAVAVLLSVPATLLAKYIHSSNDVVGNLTPGEYQELTINCTDEYDSESGYYKMSLLSVTTEDKVYPLYVRVVLNVTWQNNQGQVYGQQPIPGKDFVIKINDVEWFCDINDGKYYCYTDVPIGGTTEPLIGKDTSQKLLQLRKAPAEGYKLKVEIAAQAIQAVGQTSKGTPAVEDAWGEHPRPD